MKRISIVFTFFLVAAFYGCSTTNVNSNSNILPTCAANLTSENESQEKQCCLKDSLNIIIKQEDKICKSEEMNDIVVNVESSTTNISPSIKYAPKKELKVDSKIENQSNKVYNSGIGCIGHNCEINNIYFENKTEIEENNSLITCIKKIKSLNEIYPYYILLLLLVYITFILVDCIHFYINNFKIQVYRTITFIEQICFFLISILKQEKQNRYEILAPYINKKISDQTTKQLEFAVIKEQEQIKNIAITGRYGAGKSSIWESFAHKRIFLKTKNPIRISFANFNNTQNTQTNTKFAEFEIERVIIQQLIYSKENKDLKYSSFKKINIVQNYKIFFLAFLYLFLFSATSFATGIIFFPASTKIILSQVNQYYAYDKFITIFSILTIISFLFYITSWLIFKASKIKISKLCINNIELSFDKNNSLFDKYLNEIVYFFEATKSKIVIIEDLDRFDSSLKIFTKLREINTLLNNYPAIQKTGTVKFIYMIKDDTLSKYERTKFFDYIIPVIPTLSVSNSASIFRRELINQNNHNEKIDLDDDYLLSLQDHLKDFRLLKNCINEFYIYKDEIKNIKTELLDYEINALLNKQDTTYIDKLINKKIFSLVLYKNLFPRDFSSLEKNEGVLFDCLNHINEKLEITEDKVFNKAIKEILTTNNTPNSRDKFKKLIELLNKKWDLKGKECVDPDLLITMLFNGYIENDYEMYIKKYDGSILNYKEQAFLLNVKNDFAASKNLDLRKSKIELICKNIQKYQWNSPGIINEKIIDYILQNKATDNDKKVEGIIEAMYAYDSKQPEKFIPQYFEHCQFEKIDIIPLLKEIDIVLGKSTEEKCINILGCFFYDTDINLFIDFLKNVEPDLSIYDLGSTIGKFIDSSKESFKNKLNQYSDFNLLLSLMENDGVKIALTPEICKKLISHKMLSSKIYKINKVNIDLILSEFNLPTDEQNYLTKCLSIDDLKETILNNYTYPFFNRILSKFENVDEDYSAIKMFFEFNKKAKFIIPDEMKKVFFKKISSKWEKFVLYNHFISFDDYLSESIKKFMALNDSNQEISDSLKKDESGIKEFIRAVIKEPKLDISILNDIFLPYWRKYVPSILSCYNGEEQEIQNLPQDRNNLLQVNAIVYESNYLGQVMLDLVIQDPEYFELNYPEEDYEKDSEFRLLVLDSKAESIDKIKRRFFEKIAICPTKNEDARRYRIYINAGHHLQNDTVQNYNTIYNGVTKISFDINALRDFDKHSLNSYSVNQTFDFASTWFKETNDPLSILLIRTFMYWFNKLTNFIKNNSIHHGNEIQCLKDCTSNDIVEANKRIKEYKNLIQMIDLWIDEMKRYAQTFLPF